MYILVDTSERLHVSLIQTFQCTLGKLSIIVYLFRLNVIKKKVKREWICVSNSAEFQEANEMSAQLTLTEESHSLLNEWHFEG